jgi:hypothetical protein
MTPADHPDDDPPPVEPTPPDGNACCGSGCDPCVWDLYDAERTRYVEALRAWRERQARKPQTPPA